MGEVLNLRLARKAARRAMADATATRNRAAFGLTEAARAAARAAALHEQARRDRVLDHARRDRKPPDDS